MILDFERAFGLKEGMFCENFGVVCMKYDWLCLESVTGCLKLFFCLLERIVMSSLRICYCASVRYCEVRPFGVVLVSLMYLQYVKEDELPISFDSDFVLYYYQG